MWLPWLRTQFLHSGSPMFSITEIVSMDILDAGQNGSIMLFQ